MQISGGQTRLYLKKEKKATIIFQIKSLEKYNPNCKVYQAQSEKLSKFQFWHVAELQVSSHFWSYFQTTACQQHLTHMTYGCTKIIHIFSLANSNSLVLQQLVWVHFSLQLGCEGKDHGLQSRSYAVLSHTHLTKLACFFFFFVTLEQKKLSWLTRELNFLSPR